MDVKCFEWGSAIQADSVQAVADAFVAHGREKHKWSYPEAGLRNYAGNYAEAALRLTGPMERLPRIGKVTVHHVSESRVDDWLKFFDHDGFAGNPDWASCYCLHPHVPPTAEEPERPWREVRERMIERLRAGRTHGHLAYVDGQTAGWVNASLRADYGQYATVDPDGPGPSSVIGVSCYVVAPPFRRHGIASALLDHVIAEAHGRGASWIEAYPHNKPEAGDAGHFRGARSIYDSRGFQVVSIRERDTVMRRRVD